MSLPARTEEAIADALPTYRILTPEAQKLQFYSGPRKGFIPMPLSAIALFSANSHALMPILQIICSIVFFVGGVSEFRRTDGGFQPLDFSEADKTIRRLVAVIEIASSLLLFVQQITSIVTIVLLVLCVGSIVMDPSIFRRSPMLPVLCILLAVVAVYNRGALEYWRSHDLMGLFQDIFS